MIKRIESLAEKVLSSASITSVPVPVEEIAQRENILISTASSKNFSGVLYTKENVAFIAINSKEPLVRQRFTIAHELGHYFLHPKVNTFIEFRDNKKNIERGIKEIEANKFAAAILMPRKFLEKDVCSFSEEGISQEHIKILAQKYNVSEDAMNFRLINLHLL